MACSEQFVDSTSVSGETSQKENESTGTRIFMWLTKNKFLIQVNGCYAGILAASEH